MTAQFRDSIDKQQGKKKGGIWITGSGTSLDDISLEKLDGKDIISLNYSILKTQHMNAWWVYYDMRVYGELFDKLNRSKPLNCYIHHRGCSQMREYKGAARFVEYKDGGEFKPSKTCLETALMISDFLGYSEAYLVGIDAFGFSANGKAYAKGLEKKCRFAEEGNHKSFMNSQKNFLEAVGELNLDIKVYRISDIYPDDGPFEKSTFEECLTRSNGWKLKKK